MSILPQVADGQKLCIGTIARDFDRIKRDDISRSLAKRVPGRSGETVAVHKGEAFRGTLVSERYGPPPCRAPFGHSPGVVDQETCRMPVEHHPWGSVANAGIAGKTMFACWPPDGFGVVR